MTEATNAAILRATLEESVLDAGGLAEACAEVVRWRYSAPGEFLPWALPDAYEKRGVLAPDYVDSRPRSDRFNAYGFNAQGRCVLAESRLRGRGDTSSWRERLLRVSEGAHDVTLRFVGAITVFSSDLIIRIPHLVRA